jgi:hypothetical protein
VSRLDLIPMEMKQSSIMPTIQSVQRPKLIGWVIMIGRSNALHWKKDEQLDLNDSPMKMLLGMVVKLHEHP